MARVHRHISDQMPARYRLSEPPNWAVCTIMGMKYSPMQARNSLGWDDM
jgi:hypothetical protein